jgi:hypothetical protein
VRAVARHSDGRIVVGGSFTRVNGTDVRGLARLSADGSLDASWSTQLGANADAVFAPATVRALAVDSADRVYVGGIFTSIAGSATPYLVRLTPSGALDQAWNPAADDAVTALVLDEPNGVLYAAGAFEHVHGQTHESLVRIPIGGDGTPDAGWTASSLSAPEAMLLRNGSLFLGGSLGRVNGYTYGALAKLSAATGQVDLAWQPRVNGIVQALAHDPVSGQLIVGGQFEQVNDVPRHSIARISESGAGSLDMFWNPTVPGQLNIGVLALAADAAASRVYVSVERTLLRLNLTGPGYEDGAWTRAVDGFAGVIALQPDASLYAAGTFRSIGSCAHESLCHIASDGTTDGAFAPYFNDANARLVNLMENGPGGHETYVAGEFSRIDGVVRPGLARLVDGELDLAWHGSTTNGVISALHVTADGTGVIVGGSFTRIGALSRGSLARLDTVTGDPVAAFDAGSGFVNTIVGDGVALYVAGSRSQGGITRERIAKLSATTGAIDPAWNPAPPDGYIDVLAVGPGNKLYACGTFTAIGGGARPGFARISTAGAGALDTAFAPDAALGCTYGSVLPAGNSVYVSGVKDGEYFGKVVKLDAATGAADPIFQPQETLGGARSLVLDGHNGLLAIGKFNVGGYLLYGPRRMSIGTGGFDSSFAPYDYTEPFYDSRWRVNAIVRAPAGGIFVAGGFDRMGGAERHGFAALPTGAPIFFELYANPNPTAYAVAYEAHARVVSAFDQPPGVVRFEDGIGHACEAAMDGIGHASCLLASSGWGTRTLTATFVPQTPDYAAGSATFLHGVSAPADLFFADGFE